MIEELSSHETFLHRVVRISYVALSHNERDLTHSSTLTRRAQEEGPRVPADATPSGGGGGDDDGGDDDPPLLIPVHVLAGDSESDEDEVLGEAAGSESDSPHHVSSSSSGAIARGGGSDGSRYDGNSTGIARGGLFGVGLAAGLVGHAAWSAARAVGRSVVWPVGYCSPRHRSPSNS